MFHTLFLYMIVGVVFCSRNQQDLDIGQIKASTWRSWSRTRLELHRQYFVLAGLVGIQINLSAAPWSWTWQFQNSEKCQKFLAILFNVGQAVGNTSREMELDLFLQMVLQDSRSGSQRGGGGEGSGETSDHSGRRMRVVWLTEHPKQQERAQWLSLAWMHLIPWTT